MKRLLLTLLTTIMVVLGTIGIFAPKAQAIPECEDCEPIIQAWGITTTNCNDWNNVVYSIYPNTGQNGFTFRFEASGGGVVTAGVQGVPYPVQIIEDNVMRSYEIEVPVSGTIGYDLHLFTEAKVCKSVKDITQKVKNVSIFEW